MTVQANCCEIRTSLARNNYPLLCSGFFLLTDMMTGKKTVGALFWEQPYLSSSAKFRKKDTFFCKKLSISKMSSIFVTSDLCLMVPSNFLKPSYVCFKWTLIQYEMEHAEFRTRQCQLFSVKILSVEELQRPHRSSTGAAQHRWIGSRMVRVVGVYIKEKTERIQVHRKINNTNFTYFCPLPCPLYLLRAPMPIPCAFLPCATGNSALVIGLCLLAAEDTGLSSFHLGVLVVGN